jgi:hypothetical protein
MVDCEGGDWEVPEAFSLCDGDPGYVSFIFCAVNEAEIVGADLVRPVSTQQHDRKALSSCSPSPMITVENVHVLRIL